MIDPIRAWQEKKEYLEQQLAIIADPNQKFTLCKQIEECDSEIASYSAPQRLDQKMVSLR